MHVLGGLEAPAGQAGALAAVLLLLGWFAWRLNVLGSFRTHVYDKRGKRVPGPPNAWPFGFVWQIREYRRQNIWWIKSRELFQEYGALIGFRVFSSYSVLVVDPDHVRAIVTGSADAFPKGHLYSQLGLLPGGLFTTNGPRWRKDRRVLNPKFHYEAVAGYVRGFNRHATAFVDGVRRRLALTKDAGAGAGAGAGDVMVDMMDAFSRLTLDVICDAGFGHQLHSYRRSGVCVGANHQVMEALLPEEEEEEEEEEEGEGGEREEEIADAMRLAFKEIGKRLTDPLLILKYLPHRWRKTRQATRIFRRVLEAAIRAREERLAKAESGDDSSSTSDSGEGSLLDLMLALHDDGTWTTDHLLIQSMTFLIAGHETTGAMLAWTLLELGEHPAKLARLRAEIDAVVGDSAAIEAGHLEAMPYLRCVFKESLRLHPPVTVFSRQTTQDLPLGEYLIPAGWHVGVSVYCLHRHPALWERPDDFWPERWLGDDEEKEAAAAAAAAPPQSAAAAAAAGATSPARPSPNPQETSTKTPPPSPPQLAPAASAPLPAAAPMVPPPSVAADSSSTAKQQQQPPPSLRPPAHSYSAEASVGEAKGHGPLKSPFQYVPFSLGPRNCIGQRFGLMEASVILARLLRDFDVALVDRRHSITPYELLTVRPSRLLCRLTPRNHAAEAAAAAAAESSSSGSRKPAVRTVGVQVESAAVPVRTVGVQVQAPSP